MIRSSCRLNLWPLNCYIIYFSSISTKFQICNERDTPPKFVRWAIRLGWNFRPYWPPPDDCQTNASRSHFRLLKREDFIISDFYLLKLWSWETLQNISSLSSLSLEPFGLCRTHSWLNKLIEINQTNHRDAFESNSNDRFQWPFQ